MSGPAAGMDWRSRTWLMAIINATPDSFSGDGVFEDRGAGDAVAAAVDYASDAIANGADILDVGGESTRPGAEAVSAEEELERVIPVIEALSSRFETLISVDTYKAGVAKAALDAGADIINDVWGLRADSDLALVAASSGVPIILMHNRSTPNNVALLDKLGGYYQGVEYEDLLEDVERELMISVEIARKAGISDSQIILDPGIGFGKTVSQNLQLLNHADRFHKLGFPMLIGPSRKSFIGLTLDLPPDERLEGTAASVVMAMVKGANIIRVHDVRAMSRVMRMTDAILGADRSSI